MQLFHKKYGESGTPLLILHGLFGMLDNWHNLARTLGEKYQVYLLDLRNHGQSPHSDEMDYALMADDIKEFMDDNSMEKAFIMGHSMGGKVAMQFALSYPEKAEKLIVVDIAPVKYPPGHNEIFEGLFSLDIANAATRKELDEKLAEKVPEFSVRQFLLKSLARDEQQNFSWKFNLQSIYDNYDLIIDNIPATGTYEGPALFIAGGESSYVQEEYTGAIRELFPEAEILIIAGSGHWVHAEKPAELLTAVATFLG